jgi:hypothetical protein
MQRQIRGEIKELTVTQVTIAIDPNDTAGDNLHMFHCFNCRNWIAQYQGYIFMIAPGRSPCALPVYVKCPNCRTLYSFNAII